MILNMTINLPFVPHICKYDNEKYEVACIFGFISNTAFSTHSMSDYFSIGFSPAVG